MIVNLSRLCFRGLLFLLLYAFPLYSISQNSPPGEVHGNFQTDLQYYNSDTIIGAPPVDEKALMRSFANLNYTIGKFRAGTRYESYLNTLQGFDPRYEGNAFQKRLGLGNKYK